MRIKARPVAQRLARGDVAVDAARLEHDADLAAQRAAAPAGVVPEHRDLAAAARAVALEDLDRRRLAGAVRAEQAEHLTAAHGYVDPAHRLELAVALAQRVNLDRRRVAHGSIISASPRDSRRRARARGSTSARPASASPSRSAR